MPFSFKPDVATETPSVEKPATQASFGSSVSTASPAPSQSLGQSPAERPRGEGRSILQMSLFALLGFTAFVAVGLFIYKYYLSAQVDAKKAALSEYESRLGVLPLDDMRRLSNRLKIINQLVRDHPSVNVAFLIVEASVENMITYNKFDLRYVDTNKTYQISLAGLAPDYKSVAQQIDTYKRKPYSTYMSKISVDGLHPDTSGQISFSFTAPISIQGLIPETFSIMDGSSSTSLASSSTVDFTASSTAPINATTTSPVTATSSHAIKP